MREPRCNGALLLDQHAVMEELVGVPTVRAALAKLPAEIREEYAGVQAISWCTVRTADAVLEAIALEAQRQPLQFQAEVARLGVERTVSKLWRPLLRLTTDAALVKRMPLLHSKTYDTGKMDARVPLPGRAEIVLRDWSSVPEIDLVALASGIEAVLRVAGRIEPRTRYERTREGALFVTTWKV